MGALGSYPPVGTEPRSEVGPTNTVGPTPTMGTTQCMATVGTVGTTAPRLSAPRHGTAAKGAASRGVGTCTTVGTRLDVTTTGNSSHIAQQPIQIAKQGKQEAALAGKHSSKVLQPHKTTLYLGRRT